MKKLFVDGLYLLPVDSSRARRARPPEPWVLDLPVFRGLFAGDTLRLTRPVTVITGENATGKSTFLEALAQCCGFSPGGGPYTGHPTGSAENRLLGRAAALLTDRPMSGWFLRAEAHHATATGLGSDGPGVTDLNAMSHGESVFQVIGHAFHKDGLFLLDEPESGLSTVRQMALMAELEQIARFGAQVVVVTHSPVVAAVPGADLWEVDVEESIIHRADVRETTCFRAMRDFLDDPETIAEYMVDVTAP